jgi:hypothetical protein
MEHCQANQDGIMRDPGEESYLKKS